MKIKINNHREVGKELCSREWTARYVDIPVREEINMGWDLGIRNGVSSYCASSQHMIRVCGSLIASKISQILVEFVRILNELS